MTDERKNKITDLEIKGLTVLRFFYNSCRVLIIHSTVNFVSCHLHAVLAKVQILLALHSVCCKLHVLYCMPTDHGQQLHVNAFCDFVSNRFLLSC